MKKNQLKKIVSFLCSTALLLTQAIAVLPASAETESGLDALLGTTLVHEASFDNGGTYILNQSGLLSNDATIDVSIAANSGVDGSSAMKVVMNNPTDSDKKAVIWPKNDENSLYSMGDSGTLTADKHYKYIVRLKYKVETGSSVIVEIGSGCANETAENCGYLTVSGNSFMTQENGDITAPGAWDLAYSPIYGEWTEISLPLDMCSTRNAAWQRFAIDFKQNAGKTATIYFDDIKLYKVDDADSEMGLVFFSANGGKALNPVAGIVGTEYTMPTPVRDGYEFAGWYTDADFTTPYDGTFPANNLTATHGKGYSRLYAKWKSEPKTVLYDDFERVNVAYKDVSNKGGEAIIVEGESIDNSSALLVDMSAADGTRVVLKPQNSDGSVYSIKSGDAVNLIVKFSYRMDTASFRWGPLWLKPIIGNESFGGLQTLSTLIVGQNVNTPTHTTYNILSTKATGEWRTVSFPISATATQSGDFMLFFDTTDQKGSMLIDNLEVISLTSDLKSTAMSLNLNNGATTPELVTMVAGDDISKLPVPEKSGYTFAGWYTNSALTQKCEVVPKTTEKYISLYAGYDVPYYTVTEDYQRYTGANVQENLSSAFPSGQTFAVEEDNGNKYLHIVTDGASISNNTYLIKNADGTALNQSFVNGTTYSLLISLKYKINSANGYGLILKPLICDSEKNWLLTSTNYPWKHIIHFGDIRNDLYCHGIKDNEWHTMSLAVDYTPTADYANTEIGFQIDIGNRAVDVCLDDISVQVLPRGISASTVNLDGVVNGQTFIAGAVGTEITVDGAKLADILPKNIYKRGAKFTGYTIGNTVFNGTFPSADGRLAAAFENAVSVYDYNFDTEVNILDLVRLKKNLATDSDYANSVPDGGVLLAELRKALLSLDTAKTIGDVSYTLAYSDEFNGTAIDSSIWNVGESTGIVTYDNKVFYKTVLDKNHVSESDGTAKISFGQDADSTVSVYKDANGTYYCNPTNEQITDSSLTLVNEAATLKTVYGGAMRTNGNLEVKRGYIEANVKFASETIDEAFWLNATATPTLRYNEIDIFETFGNDSAISNIHTWDNNYKLQGGTDFHYNWSSELGDSRVIATGIYDGKFHTIGLQWEENYLKFYFDGELKLTVSNTESNSERFTAFANALLYTEFSATPKTGFGSWSGLDSSFEIDYIRYYQNAGSEFGIR